MGQAHPAASVCSPDEPLLRNFASATASAPGAPSIKPMPEKAPNRADNDNGFVTVQRRKRQSRTNKNRCGKAPKDPEVSLRAAKPNTSVYISRLHYTTKAEDIVRYVRQKRRYMPRVQLLESHWNVNFKAFVVRVPNCYLPLVMEEDLATGRGVPSLPRTSSTGQVEKYYKTIMYPVEKCVLFQRTEEEVKAVRQVFGLTENSIREGVDSIMEWFQKQPHLVHIKISSAIVEMMIIIAKGSIERAKEKIDNFYKCRFLMPEFIQNRQQMLCTSNKVWNLFTIIAMPKLQDNRRIYIVKFGPEMSNFDVEEFFRRVCLLLDLRMIYDYMAGDIWILDMEHVGWTQILTQNPLVFKKIVHLFTKSLNWRIYGIHVINLKANTNIVQRIIDFFKQFITSIIMDRIVIHDSLQDLYKYVPKECLPENYGGNELSSDKLVEITENFYKNPKITEFLLECSKMVSNESLRPRDENSEEFISGSFRQLEVD